MIARYVLACVLALTAGVIPAAAQRIPYDGSELFRFALHKKELKPLNDASQALESPQTSLIVVLGDTKELSSFISSPDLRRFLFRGGALLIATHESNLVGKKNDDLGWGSEFGISITGRLVTAPAENCYQGNHGQPFVKPRPKKPFAGSPSPFDLFEGVGHEGATAIATDHPSEMYLNRGTPNLTVHDLAGYPDDAEYLQVRMAVPKNSNRFAVSGQINEGSGRMLVFADHKVFANGLMGFKPKPEGDGYFTDNGNWEFTQRNIDWLQISDGHKRSQCLFIEDGHIVTKFAQEVPNQPRPPMPDIPPEVIANWLLNTANSIIQEKQEEDWFNRFLLGNFGFPWLARLFLLTVTILFLFMALRWLRRGLRKAEPTSTLTKNVQTSLLPRGGVLRQRTASQIEVGNLHEAARRRVRSQFDVLGAAPNASGKMPPVLTANDLPDGLLMQQTIRWLWAVGYGESPVRISPAEWDRLNALLERMTVRAARGDWSFGQEA